MIVIDINSVGYASTAANPTLKSGDLPTGGIFGTIRTLRTLRQDHAGKMLALHDGHSWRYDHFPEYKANRVTTGQGSLIIAKNQWTQQRPIVAHMLQAMGVNQLSSQNMEADDLAARICDISKENITLITGDKDWLQLVNPNVSWVDPIRARSVTMANFKEFTDCDNPWQFIQGKALAGDQGDNIPPAGGVGPAAAKWIFENVGSVDSLLNQSIERDSSKWPKKIIDFVDSQQKIDNYKRNLLLVWLLHPHAPPALDMHMRRGEIDVDAFCKIAEELNFHSILRDPEAWLEPFIREAAKEENT